MEPNPAPRRRSYGNLSRPDRLLAVDGALNAFDTIPEIAARMARRGYDAEELARGRALYEAALASRGTQATRKGTRLVATAAQNDLLDAAHALYAPLAESARVVFADRREVLTALGLTGRHAQSFGARLDRMRLFVQEARVPERLAEFTAVDDGPEKFDALEAALAAAAQGVHTQDERDALSQAATPTAKEAFKAMDKWMTTMHGHGRIALADEPQYLEALGLRPRP